VQTLIFVLYRISVYICIYARKRDSSGWDNSANIPKLSEISGSYGGKYEI
jgi:hypothetical protein